MRKLLWLIVCLMTMVVSANAQKDYTYAVKQAGLNALKRTLIAPSQFVLTDYNGKRISINEIKIIDHVKSGKPIEWIDSVFFYKGNKWSFRDVYDEPDSIIIYKWVQEPNSSYYVVRIIGDARNRAGGYEQIIRDVYVYGEKPNFFGTMNLISPKSKKYYVKTMVINHNF